MEWWWRGHKDHSGVFKIFVLPKLVWSPLPSTGPGPEWSTCPKDSSMNRNAFWRKIMREYYSGRLWWNMKALHCRVPVCNSGSPNPADFDRMAAAMTGTCFAAPVIVNCQVIQMIMSSSQAHSVNGWYKANPLLRPASRAPQPVRWQLASSGFHLFFHQSTLIWDLGPNLTGCSFREMQVGSSFSGLVNTVPGEQSKLLAIWIIMIYNPFWQALTSTCWRWTSTRWTWRRTHCSGGSLMLWNN